MSTKITQVSKPKKKKKNKGGKIINSLLGK